MSNFPALSGKKLIKILQKLGFNTIRIKGSHHFLRHCDGRSATVPYSFWRKFRDRYYI